MENKWTAHVNLAVEIWCHEDGDWSFLINETTPREPTDTIVFWTGSERSPKRLAEDLRGIFEEELKKDHNLIC
jgi:hypothetical protein